MPGSTALRDTDGPGGRATVLRQATPADREAILAVSALFPNDWIPYVIDDALGAERGGFFVAERAGRVIAICAANVHDCDQGDAAWLEAMRVDPAFQNAGVATALTRYVLDRCTAWGCRYARLSTSVSNRPVHHFIGDKLGFSNLGRWVFVDDLEDWDPFGAAPATPPLPVPDLAGIRPAGPGDLSAIWSFIADRCRRGLIEAPWMISPLGDPWRVVDLTEAELGRQLRAGRAFVHETGQTRGATGPAGRRTGDRSIDGLVLFSLFPADPGRSIHRAWACVSFLEGDAPVVARLLAEALAAARRDGLAVRLAVSLPQSQWETLRTVTRPDWPAGGPSLEAFIYQKDLRHDATARGDP